MRYMSAKSKYEDMRCACCGGAVIWDCEAQDYRCRDCDNSLSEHEVEKVEVYGTVIFS